MCKEAIGERIKNEYERFNLTLRCTSIDQVFSRARKIGKVLKKNSAENSVVC